MDVVQNLLQSKSKVIAKHLVARQATYKKIRVFIYGHTHQFENPWSVDLDGLTTVSVANTSAFQCLLDEPGFLKRLNGRTPQDALRTMTLNELPACYSAVIVEAAADGTIPYEAMYISARRLLACNVGLEDVLAADNTDGRVIDFDGIDDGADLGPAGVGIAVVELFDHQPCKDVDFHSGRWFALVVATQSYKVRSGRPLKADRCSDANDDRIFQPAARIGFIRGGGTTVWM